MLNLIPIPDCRVWDGPSQVSRGYQLQPGTADYPAGGYVIPGALSAASASVIGKLNSEFIYGGSLMGGNQASAAFLLELVLPSGSFSTTNPQPATQITVQVGQNTSAGTSIGLGPVSAGVSTLIAVTSNVITVTQPNTLLPGQFVLFRSTGAGAAISGTIMQVATASATQWTANYPTPNIGSTADVTITYQLVQAGTGNQVTTGAVANITNSLATSGLLTMTCANTFVPGQFVIIQGLTNGATANGVIAQILTASPTTFTANWTGTAFGSAADVGTASLLVTAGGAPVQTGNVATVTNSLATASSAGTAGVVTLTAQNNYAPNNILVVQGLTNGAAVNGDLLVVNAASLTNTTIVSNHKTAAFSSAADSGALAILVTGTPTAFQQVSPGTDLSACSWFVNFLTVGD